MNKRVVAAIAVVSALALSSCSGGGDDKPKDSAAKSASDAASITPEDVPSVPSLKHERGIIADADVATCSTDPKDLVAKGTVENTAKSERDIVVVVNWTSPTSDVLARGVAKLKGVAPGASEKWSIEAAATDDVTGSLQCVPSVTAGQLS